MVAPVESVPAIVETKEPETTVNAQKFQTVKSVGQIVGHFPAIARAQKHLTENAQRNIQQNAQTKIIGQIHPKSLGISGNAQTRTEWFRYELDFRERDKGGYYVIIRRRLKWSRTRHAPTIANHLCVGLTKRMVASIKVGKFTDAAISALHNGGINHGVIQKLKERIGKGNGKRASELTEHERSVLARIESNLGASNGGRNDRAATVGGQLGISDCDVLDTSDGMLARVPTMR